MKVLFLTDNFPPEYNAPATRTYEHCREWVRKGADVTVITCFPNFPGGKVFEGYRNKWKQTEEIDGIRVIRVWSYISANKGTFKRTLDFLSYAVTSFIAGLGVKCDVIVATSPQFFTAVSGCALGFFKRRRWVMEVRDIWPESIKAVEAVDSGFIIRQMEKLELFLYRRAWRVIVVTDSFRANLTERAVPPEKIAVVKNGVDLSFFSPRPKDQALIKKLRLSGKFTVGYIGTHGLAHGLDFILRCVKSIPDESIHFLFIGDGAEKARLVELADSLSLKNVTFLDPIPKREVPTYLSIIDVALVPLRKSTTFESVIPSKIFESAAMQIPMLLGVDGEVRSMVERYPAGVYFEPENEVDFVQKLYYLRDALSQNPRRFIEGCSKLAYDFDRRRLASEMLNALIEKK